MDEATRNRLFCKVVGRLLIADGLLTDEESEFLTRMFDSIHLTQKERNAIIGGIDIDSELDQQIADLSVTETRFLIALLKEATVIDGSLAVAEQDVIGRVHAFLEGDRASTG